MTIVTRSTGTGLEGIRRISVRCMAGKAVFALVVISSAVVTIIVSCACSNTVTGGTNIIAVRFTGTTDSAIILVVGV